LPSYAQRLEELVGRRFQNWWSCTPKCKKCSAYWRSH